MKIVEFQAAKSKMISIEKSSVRGKGGGMMSQAGLYTVSKAQYIGSRSRQEDALSVSLSEDFEQRGILLVLSDGMGGMANGHLFSRLAVEEMQNAFRLTDPTMDMPQTLQSCFDAAQEKAVAMNLNAEDEGGATVVAVLIRDGKCSFLSVGDSRLALIRTGGLIWLNRPQVMSTRLDENVALGYLRQEDVQGSALRDAVIGFMGSSVTVSCDACPEPFVLVPSDRIALMSDGITGTLDEQELLMYLLAPKEIAAEEVIQAVQRKNHPDQDNSSILLAVVE